MDKAKLYKGLKTFFFLMGFPLFLTIMLITLAPMFDMGILGGYARNWVLIFFAIWAAVLIIYFVLNKFVGSKSKNHRKLVLAVMAAVSIMAVLLPTTIFDAAMRPKFEDARATLGDNVGDNYDSVAGWHRGFTDKTKNDAINLINDNYDFMKMYGLDSEKSDWYGHADAKKDGQTNWDVLGFKPGTFDKAAKLVADKKIAKVKLAASIAELEGIETAIKAKLDAYTAAQAAEAADGSQANKDATVAAKAAYDKAVKDNAAAILRLKGKRVDISAYKADIVDLLDTILTDLVTNGKVSVVFPDGVTLDMVEIVLGLLLGKDINLGMEDNLTDVVGMILGAVGGMLNRETLEGLIPDVIYSGTGKETIAAYQAMVDGSASDMSLQAVSEFNFRINYYPSVLAAGAVKFAAYMCVGLIILSLFMTEYFSQKEKELKAQKGGESND